MHRPGTPSVVRIRTEASADVDRVNQIQDGVGSRAP
jgi:hypothetical protein